MLDSSPRLIAVLPRPSSSLDAKAFTERLVRLTCFRLGTRQKESTKKLYSLVKVLDKLKAAWRFTPSRLLGRKSPVAAVKSVSSSSLLFPLVPNVTIPRLFSTVNRNSGGVLLAYG